MHILNYEFKAKVDNLAALENKLLQLNPVFKGTDHQTDTYFNAPKGRLKLREGNIENALISYNRQNHFSAKQSNVILYKHTGDKALKDILVAQLGIKTVVQKQRRIYFIDNVKFHFDEVAPLGSFIEVEAIDVEGKFTIQQLKELCDNYFIFFGLKKDDLVDKSYSDLLLTL